MIECQFKYKWMKIFNQASKLIYIEINKAMSKIKDL